MTIFLLLTFWHAFALFEAKTVLSPYNSRVIGGQPAYGSQYTFAAAIYVETNNSRFFCGGALYHNQWILTAGQCVYGATLFTIQLGSTKLYEDDSNRLTVATSEYTLHPNYNPQTLENDIAVIKLRMAVEYSDYLRPVSPLAMSELPAKPGVRVVGWGQTSDTSTSLSNELLVVTVSSLTNEECRFTYGDQIKDRMVCVQGNYNEGACIGDIGSPLLESFMKYPAIHVGIASFVSGRGCESTDPSGYTRTYPYVNWVNEVIRR